VPLGDERDERLVEELRAHLGGAVHVGRDLAGDLGGGPDLLRRDAPGRVDAHAVGAT
jgi:hypothetical protein